MYQELKEIFQYLVSVRKLKNYLSVDVEFPMTWKIPKRFVEEDKILENTKVTEGTRFFSFITEFEESFLNTTVSNIKNIVAYNKIINKIIFIINPSKIPILLKILLNDITNNNKIINNKGIEFKIEIFITKDNKMSKLKIKTNLITNRTTKTINIIS